MTLQAEWDAWVTRALAEDPGTWVGFRALCEPHGRALRYSDTGQSEQVDGWCDECDPIPIGDVDAAFPGMPTVLDRGPVGDRKRAD